MAENGDRLDRIETIILELATASVRHDNEFSRINNTLNQIAEQQQQSAIRYEQIAEQQQQWAIRYEQIAEQQQQSANEFNRINTTLKEIAEQQQQSAIHYEQRFAQNDQAIANLTASIQELRNVVADYIQGRSQI